MSVVVGLSRYTAEAVEGARVYCGVVPWCMSLCMRCWQQYMGKNIAIIIKVHAWTVCACNMAFSSANST